VSATAITDWQAQFLAAGRQGLEASARRGHPEPEQPEPADEDA
jgi:hypothetical protein